MSENKSKYRFVGGPLDGKRLSVHKDKEQYRAPNRELYTLGEVADEPDAYASFPLTVYNKEPWRYCDMTCFLFVTSDATEGEKNRAVLAESFPSIAYDPKDQGPLSPSAASYLMEHGVTVTAKGDV